MGCHIRLVAPMIPQPPAASPARSRRGGRWDVALPWLLERHAGATASESLHMEPRCQHVPPHALPKMWKLQGAAGALHGVNIIRGLLAAQEIERYDMRLNPHRHHLKLPRNLPFSAFAHPSKSPLRMYDISNGKANGWSWILGTHFPAFWHTAVVVDLPAPRMNTMGTSKKIGRLSKWNDI